MLLPGFNYCYRKQLSTYGKASQGIHLLFVCQINVTFDHRPLYKKAKKVHAKYSNMAEIVVDSLHLFVLWKLSFSMIK